MIRSKFLQDVIFFGKQIKPHLQPCAAFHSTSIALSIMDLSRTKVGTTTKRRKQQINGFEHPGNISSSTEITSS